MTSKKETREVYLVFKPEDDNQIVWPCEIEVPLSGGGHQTQTLKARFKVLPKDRLAFFYPTQIDLLAAIEKATADIARVAEAVTDGDAAEVGDAPPGRRGDDGLLDEALVGLVDVPGAEKLGEREVADTLRQKQWVSDGLVKGYMELIGRRIAKN